MLMKTTKINLNKKTLIKAMSSVLSLVLTANIGMSLLSENVFAADQGTITKTGITVITTSSVAGQGFENFYIANINGLKCSLSSDKEENAVSIDQNYNFIVQQSCTLNLNLDYTFNVLQLAGGSGSLSDAMLKINSKGTARLGSVTGSGTNEILNYGTVQMGTFNANDLSGAGIAEFNNGEAWPSGKGIFGTGKIVADYVYINNAMYSDVEGSSIIVSDYFYKASNVTINSVVQANPDTVIISAGGDFTLQVGDVKKVISGAVNSTAELLMDQATVSLGEIPSNIYYGNFFSFA